MTELNNNQYDALAGEEDNEDNDTESIGVDNGSKITGVRHDDKITGVDSNNENTESGSTGEADEADEMELIEDSIAEADQDIAEGTDILAGTVTDTEDARNKKRDTSRFAGTKSGTHIQLAAKK